MSDAAAADTTTATDAAAPGDVNYEAPALGRHDTAGAEDGDAPGAGAAAEAGAEAADEAAADVTDEQASAAGRTLAGRKPSLRDDLVSERAKSRALEADLRQREQLIEAWRPMLERLDGRPDLQQAVLEGRVTIQQAEARQAADDDAELIEIANDFDWFKTDGTPDLTKAARHRDRTARTAKIAAVAEVQPVKQTSDQQRAASQVERAVEYAIAHKDADPEFVRAEFTKIARENPASLLDPRVANAHYDMVIGRATRQGKVFKVGAATAGTRETPRETPEPDFVHTENTGGPGSNPRLTPREKQLGEQYGLTDKDWQRAEGHSQVRKGYSRLEE